MIKIMREALNGRVYGPNDYVFINPETGGPYTHNSIGKAFDKAKRRAGLDITMNEFGRHSWATQKLSEGWSYTDIAMFLLDTVVTVERNYANVTKATRKAVLELKSRLTQVGHKFPGCPEEVSD